MFDTLFKEYDMIQNEYVESYMLFSLSEIFSIERQLNYQNGIVIGKIKEKDPLTLKAIKYTPTNNELRSVILQNLQYKMPELDGVNIEQYQAINNKIRGINTLGFDDYLKKFEFRWVENSCNIIKSENYTGFLFLYYSYEQYQTRSKAFHLEQEIINELYKDRFEKSSQFLKYGLIPIDDTRELLDIDPPRIYDKSLDKTIFLENIPLPLCSKLKGLYTNGKIKDLSLRLSSDNIFEGKNEMQTLLEEVERGRIFELINLGEPEITKLYSKNYDDCLWIIIEEEDITFEELCNDFESRDESIVTQVVHLKYENIGKTPTITHIDHEYIFYTLDEYENRLHNPKQKGNSQTRKKSFKIDNANIDFNLSYQVKWKDLNGDELPAVSVPFICYILDMYFQHKELLFEYFKSVLRCES